MEDDWEQIFSLMKRRLEAVKAGMIKSKIVDPITSDLLQNLIDIVDERLKQGRMINCPDCLYVATSEQSLQIHHKMVHV